MDKSLRCLSLFHALVAPYVSHVSQRADLTNSIHIRILLALTVLHGVCLIYTSMVVHPFIIVASIVRESRSDEAMHVRKHCSPCTIHAYGTAYLPP